MAPSVCGAPASPVRANPRGSPSRSRSSAFELAGHGLQVGGKNYLVPVDAKLERAGDLALDAVDISTVLAQMEVAKRVNLVF